MAPTHFIPLQSDGSRTWYLERKIFQGNMNLILPKFFFTSLRHWISLTKLCPLFLYFPLVIFTCFIDILVLKTINTRVYCCFQWASPLLLKPWYHFDSHYLRLTTVLYTYSNIKNGYLESDYLFFLLNYRATFYSG